MINDYSFFCGNLRYARPTDSTGNIFSDFLALLSEVKCVLIECKHAVSDGYRNRSLLKDALFPSM